MPKKRNTKSPHNKSGGRIAADVFLVAVCAAGIAASLFFFRQEYNRTLVKLNEDPVGTIVFKNRVAERKFIDRLAWDRLKQESPVYSGDTIRTADASEAVVTFRDLVTTVGLAENTIVQIFYDDESGARVDFSGGSVDVNSGVLREVIVVSGGAEVAVAGSARLNKTESDMSISVVDGAASVAGDTIASGEARLYDGAGRVAAVPLVAVTSLGRNSRIVNRGETVPVNFAWSASNFTPDTLVRIEISSDRYFANIVESREVADASEVTIPLENGPWYWRAYPAVAETGAVQIPESAASTGRLQVIPQAEINLRTPAPSAEVAPGAVPFSWSAVEGAQSYLVEVADNAALASPAVYRRVAGASVSETELPEGRWFWRVTPVFADGTESGSSAIREFAVTSAALAEETVAVAPPPVLSESGTRAIFPPDGYGLSVADLGALRFTWAGGQDAEKHLQIARAADFAAPVLNELLEDSESGNGAAALRASLEPGDWYWRIASSSAGAQAAYTAPRRFTVRPIVAPTAPVPAPELAAAEPPPPPPAPPAPVPQPEPPQPAAPSRREPVAAVLPEPPEPEPEPEPASLETAPPPEPEPAAEPEPASLEIEPEPEPEPEPETAALETAPFVPEPEPEWIDLEPEPEPEPDIPAVINTVAPGMMFGSASAEADAADGDAPKTVAPGVLYGQSGGDVPVPERGPAAPKSPGTLYGTPRP